MSASPFATIASACFGSVMRPTAIVVIPVARRIARAKGTCTPGPVAGSSAAARCPRSTRRSSRSRATSARARMRSSRRSSSRHPSSRSRRSAPPAGALRATRRAPRRTPPAESGCAARNRRRSASSRRFESGDRNSCSRYPCAQCNSSASMPAASRALRGGDEGVADAHEPGGIEGRRRRFAVRVRNRRRRDRRPAVVGERNQRAAFPWPLRRALAARVRELQRDGRRRRLPARPRKAVAERAAGSRRRRARGSPARCGPPASPPSPRSSSSRRRRAAADPSG